MAVNDMTALRKRFRLAAMDAFLLRSVLERWFEQAARLGELRLKRAEAPLRPERVSAAETRLRS